MTVRIKRVYDPPSPDDGFRLLIDRLWPRGLTKSAAAADEWMRDVAPSTALRTWYHHQTEKWPEFRERYLAELATNSALVERIRELEREHGTVTLLYGAKDEQHNQATVLADEIHSGGESPSH